MPKNVCFAAFSIHSRFCVNINEDLKLRGVGWRKALQGVCASRFLSGGFWYSLRSISSRVLCLERRTDLIFIPVQTRPSKTV